MRRIQRVVFSLLLLSSTAISMSYAVPEKFGVEISNRTVTAIKDILADPKSYEGKLVTIEGKIANECMSGCWFDVKVVQGNAVMYVDIGKSGFAIPQYVGKKVLVEGTVAITLSGPMIEGRGVEVQ
jgi:hypothetical protein